MKIFNSLSGKKEDLSPAETGKISIYVCAAPVLVIVNEGFVGNLACRQVGHKWIIDFQRI